MCKKEICCLEITIAARIVGMVGLVSTFNIKYILETKGHVIIWAYCLFADYISTIKALEWDYKCAFWSRKATGSYQPPNNAFGDEC
jgi:hypothetical protein